MAQTAPLLTSPIYVTPFADPQCKKVLALQAFRFLTSKLATSLFYRGPEKPSHLHRDTKQICGRTRGELRSGPFAYLCLGHPHHQGTTAPSNCSFPRASSFLASNLIPITILGARWWLYPPLLDKEMRLRVVKSDPGQQHWQ